MTNVEPHQQPERIPTQTFFAISPGKKCWFCQTEQLIHPFAVQVEHGGAIVLYLVCSLRCAAAVIEEIPELSLVVISEDEIRNFVDQRRPKLIVGLRVGCLMIAKVHVHKPEVEGPNRT